MLLVVYTHTYRSCARQVDKGVDTCVIATVEAEVRNSSVSVVYVVSLRIVFLKAALQRGVPWNPATGHSTATLSYKPLKCSVHFATDLLHYSISPMPPQCFKLFECNGTPIPVPCSTFALI